MLVAGLAAAPTGRNRDRPKRWMVREMDEGSVK